MAAKSKPNEINIIRMYDAPLKAVWDAWTDPKKAAKWWGPRGFTITTHGKELKPGGFWHYTMHGPDGVDYPNKTIYLEVEKHAKLVYDHGGNDDQPPLFRVTVYFSEVAGKTRMDMTMAMASAEAAEQSYKAIKKHGGNSTWDRLAEYVEKESSGKEKFVINRSFDASLDVMFDMWTNPKHIPNWLPPTGMKMEFVKAPVIKSGAETFYRMHAEGGMELYGKIHYLNIQKPDLLVYTQHFTDANGRVGRHPMAPVWPESMLTTVQLTAEGAEQTRVTITWEPEGTVTAEELAAFVKERGGMTQGWTGSFDKLEDYLK